MKNMKLVTVFLGAMLLLGILFWGFNRSFAGREKAQPALTPGNHYEPKRLKDTSTDLATTTSASYKLVVGANPTVNQKQTFSPPTNSVVVTNQAQLDLFTKQAKESRQQQVNQK